MTTEERDEKLLALLWELEELVRRVNRLVAELDQNEEINHDHRRTSRPN